MKQLLLEEGKSSLFIMIVIIALLFIFSAGKDLTKNDLQAQKNLENVESNIWSGLFFIIFVGELVGFVAFANFIRNEFSL